MRLDLNPSNRAPTLAIIAAATLGFTGCGTCKGPPAEIATVPTPESPPPTEAATPAVKNELPLVVPANWDPIAFNRDRGNSGAIPKSYLDDINGPDGEAKHLGKHLSYVPDTSGLDIPDGYIALMWGDPNKGHAKHPNAPEGAEGYPDGHWYDWIKIRKATTDSADEIETKFSNWPEPGSQDTGKYLVAGNGAIKDDSGKKTIYLIRLPADVRPGDTIRVWAHCLYHGEYVDFVTVE